MPPIGTVITPTGIRILGLAECAEPARVDPVSGAYTNFELDRAGLASEAEAPCEPLREQHGLELSGSAVNAPGDGPVHVSSLTE